MSALIIFIYFPGFSFYFCFVVFIFQLHVWLTFLRWSWSAERPSSDEGGVGGPCLLYSHPSVCFVSRATPLCISRFFHIPQSVLGQNCSHPKPESNDLFKSVHQGECQVCVSTVKTELPTVTPRLQRVGRMMVLLIYHLWSVLNSLISESFRSIVSFLFALALTAFFLLILLIISLCCVISRSDNIE